jgi:aspartate dehydrogenase
MTTDGRRCRLAIIGLGRIGTRILQRLPGTPHAPDLAGVLVRETAREAAEALVGAGRVFTRWQDLATIHPDVVVEAAGAAALVELGPLVLASGADLMPLSLAALADPGFEATLMAAAATGPGRLDIAAGAMGSVDFLAAAREDRLDDVLFRAAYPTMRWRGTPAEAMIELDHVTAPTVFLSASVRVAVRLFPRQINVAVGVAIAGLGLDRTRCELLADPALAQATFEIHAVAGPGSVRLTVAGRDAPLGADPVDYTTFAVIHRLRRRQSPVMV